MHTMLALLYFGGLAGSALTFRNLTLPETARRGYAYAAASSVLFGAVLAIGIAG